MLEGCESKGGARQLSSPSAYPSHGEDSVRVAIADDSSLFRRGLSTLLNGSGLEVTAEEETGADLLREVDLDLPDVGVLDIRMAPTFGEEGLVTAEQLRRLHPSLGILLLSTYS